MAIKLFDSELKVIISPAAEKKNCCWADPFLMLIYVAEKGTDAPAPVSYIMGLDY